MIWRLGGKGRYGVWGLGVCWPAHLGERSDGDGCVVVKSMMLLFPTLAVTTLYTFRPIAILETTHQETRHTLKLEKKGNIKLAPGHPETARPSPATTPTALVILLQVGVILFPGLLHRHDRGNRLEQIGLERLGLGGRRPAANDLALVVDQELLKVPLDALEAQQAGLLGLEPLEEGAGVVAVDVDLGHDGEGDAVVDLAELLDLFVAAGFLAAELVAGEAEHGKVAGRLLRDGLPHLLEPGVLRGEAALGSRVDDQDHLFAVVREVDLIALLCVRGVSQIMRWHGM